MVTSAILQYATRVTRPVTRKALLTQCLKAQ